MPGARGKHPATIDEAVAIGFSGLEIYGFHTLEVLQCMVERRGGGETGVAAVTCLEGDDVWRAAEDEWVGMIFRRRAL